MPHHPPIIDLSEVTLVDHTVVEVLANSVLGPAAEGRWLNLVCRRLSGRRLLRAWSDDSISVCRSVTEAQKQLGLPKADHAQPVRQAGGLIRKVVPLSLGHRATARR